MYPARRQYSIAYTHLALRPVLLLRFYAIREFPSYALLEIAYL